MSDEDRNPLLFPDNPQSLRMRGCPKCHSQEYMGKNIQGVVTWSCSKCKNQWHGGLPQEPQNPLSPVPPLNPADRPIVDFIRGPRGEVLEQRRPVNLTQDYRKGLPVPTGEE